MFHTLREAERRTLREEERNILREEERHTLREEERHTEIKRPERSEADPGCSASLPPADSSTSGPPVPLGYLENTFLSRSFFLVVSTVHLHLSFLFGLAFHVFEGRTGRPHLDH